MRLKKFIIVIITVIVLLSGIYLIVTKNSKNNKEIVDKTNKTTAYPLITNNTKEVKFTVVGDLLFESPFYKAVNLGYNKNQYFNRVKKYLLEDDISIGNMEVVIGNDNLSVSGDGYNFCAPKYIGDLVNTLDFQVLSTANNHANDRGIVGINSTIDYFKNNTNIKTVGSYKDLNDRKEMRIIETNGIKVGFTAYTLGTNVSLNDSDQHKIGLYRDPNTKKIYKSKITNEINELKSKSDLVVVIIHWGNEFTFTPNEEQKEMANFLNSLGVDVIVGSHSHSMQPIDIIGDTHKTLVYYSLGNFTSQDDDIARTKKGNETFDNAYQIGLLSKFTIEKNNDSINFKDIKTLPIINYFDSSLNNFELIPLSEYDEKLEKSHNRYQLGFNKEFINNTFNQVIDKKYQ